MVVLLLQFRNFSPLKNFCRWALLTKIKHVKYFLRRILLTVEYFRQARVTKIRLCEKLTDKILTDKIFNMHIELPVFYLYEKHQHTDVCTNIWCPKYIPTVATHVSVCMYAFMYDVCMYGMWDQKIALTLYHMNYTKSVHTGYVYMHKHIYTQPHTNTCTHTSVSRCIHVYMCVSTNSSFKP